MTSSVSGAKVSTKPRGYLGDAMWRRNARLEGDRWIDPVATLGLDRCRDKAEYRVLNGSRVPRLVRR
jgi:hypothetical protein